MVGLSILPIGIAQAVASVQTGLEQLRWLRIIGDTVFLVGVGAFAWFMTGLWVGWSYEPTTETRPVPVTPPKPAAAR
jgi:nitric oxide reductase subunit B